MLVRKESTLNGVTMTMETGRMAKQANASVLVTYGGTSVLASIVMGKEDKEDIDFLPLMVDYRDKYYAAGRIPGGVFKREAKPSTSEVLSARITDRTIRPLFPKNCKRDILVFIWVVSADGNYAADVLGTLAASAALNISDIPFEDVVSTVRVGRVDGEFIVNPTFEQLEESDMELVMSGSMDSITMVEGNGDEISEQDMLDALRFGHVEVKRQIELQKELMADASKEKVVFPELEVNDEMKNDILEIGYDRARAAILEGRTKEGLDEAFHDIHEEIREKMGEKFPEQEFLLKKYTKDMDKKALRSLVFEQEFRADGRKPNQIRPITCEVDVLPIPHGSALFTRGQTQALATTTLGIEKDELMDFYLEKTVFQRYYLHYNFPPFCTGDARPDRGASRRDLGHGHLAQCALERQIPGADEFPYTMRVVSDILESNGSSSMASVCGGSMSLMAAGVPIKKHVSGIAMGLMHDENTGDYKVLTDIQGIEDFLGDMDFKVTGTRDGITAFQMDIKIQGLSYEIMEDALAQAKTARLSILDLMYDCIDTPAELSSNAPYIEKIEIDGDYIRDIIGPGGKNIKALQAETETDVTVVEEGDKGIVVVSGVKENVRACIERVKMDCSKPEIGETYIGKVAKILDFGVVVDYFNTGTSGLIHVSELGHEFIKDVAAHYKIGDEVKFKVTGFDQRIKKLKLSVKAILPKPEKKEAPKKENTEK